MVLFLYTPREHHNVASPDQYRAVHEAFIRSRAARGARVTVHPSPVTLTARIDHNSWIVDCECGAGNAVDPEWPDARCFGCGAVHAALVFPDVSRRAAIEQALLRRLHARQRSWRPGETVADLEHENEDQRIALIPDDQVPA